MIAVDLGSNTIRFVEFDGTNWGKSFEKIVRTAEGLHQTQRIGSRAIERIIAAIAEAHEHLDFTSQDVVAYTTAAMRMALNASEAIDAIDAASGIRFIPIDAQKEANLTLSAVRYRLQKLGMRAEPFVLADIGGGSTELIRYENGKSTAISLDTGIVTLSERADTQIALHKQIDDFKNDVRASLALAPATFVLTAGTPTTIAAYLNGMDYETYDPERINGYCLRLEECYRVYDELLAMDEHERVRFVGTGREHLIIAGILMVTALYETLDCNEAIIIDDGLREGIALEYYRIQNSK
jgi:exopolyphosphatase/guanosine-5'-triphosphate,3'-diphosphate pyrophosphatase